MSTATIDVPSPSTPTRCSLGASPGSAFFATGWSRAWSKIAFGNYLESLDRAAGAVWGENYRRYWRGLQNKSRKRLGIAAERAGAKLRFGTFNSVEISWPND